MTKHVCKSLDDIVIIEGRPFTVKHLKRTIQYYENTLARSKKYRQKKKLSKLALEKGES